MKRLSQSRLSDLLSQYVDGELGDKQTREVEELLANDTQASRQLAEIKTLKGLVHQKTNLPPDAGFWTRLSTAIAKRGREEENLLPFPRKYIPSVTALGLVMLAAVGIFVFQNRTPFIEYLSRQSQQVQQVYQQTLLKGNLLPVFEKIDKNQVLQFTLFGTLPLDAHAQSALRVDESAEKGYRIDVGRTSSKPVPPVTVKELVNEVNPSVAQMKVIDSLLDFGGRQIESSVFVSENEAVAIDPGLPRLNRVILSSIAACLEPPQRVRFERFLQARNAPYMLSSFEGHAVKPENIYDAVRPAQRPDRFLVMTPDTFVLAQIELDLDSLRDVALRLGAQRRDIQLQVNAVLRNFVDRGGTHGWKAVSQTSPFEIQADSDVIRIRVPGQIDISHPEFKDVVIRPRIPRIPFVSVPKTRSFFNFRYSRGDSGMQFEMRVDSLMIRFFRQVPQEMMNFEDVDSMLELNELQFGLQTDEVMREHLREAFRRHKVDFDSLREQIRKWMVVPPQRDRRAKKDNRFED